MMTKPLPTGNTDWREVIREMLPLMEATQHREPGDRDERQALGFWAAHIATCRAIDDLYHRLSELEHRTPV